MNHAEEWRDIPGYEGFYQASDLGNIRSLPRVIPRPTHPLGPLILKGRLLKPGTNSRGYRQVALCKDKKQSSIFVHRLVALTFLGDPEGREVNHKDADKSNNCLSNLELVTHQKNMKHAGSLGLMTRDHPRDPRGRYIQQEAA